MRKTTLSLAIFGLGLAAAPVMAQSYQPQVQAAPLPGSPVYTAPVTPPVGYAAPVTPAPGVGPAFGTVASPTMPAPTAYAPSVPPQGAAASVPYAPGVGEPVRQIPAGATTTYGAPVAPVSPPQGASASVPFAPGVGEPYRQVPAGTPVYVAPVVVPMPVATAPAGIPANPALPMQGEVLNGGDRTSAVADGVAPSQSPTALLNQAEQAARQGRLPLASELVERAESLMLTRSTIAGTESVPIRDGAVARLAQARVALGRRDVNTATALMAEAASMSRNLGM